MKNFLLTVILAPVLSFGTLCDLQADGIKGEPDQEAAYRAGFAVKELDLEIGLPLAGYGSPMRRLKPVDLKNNYRNCFFFKPSTGFHTPIRSKVMILEFHGTRIAFISLDVIGIEHDFLNDLSHMLAEYDIEQENLVVSATHTHSGPGTLSRHLPLELVAVDLFKRKNYHTILEQVAGCVIEAVKNLEPATLHTSRFTTTGLQKNKFRNPDKISYDPVARFLLVKSSASGRWLGGMVNYSVHGGGMPVDTLVYSSDFPGQIELQMENRIRDMNDGGNKPVILFVNGAEGDVGTPGRGVRLIEALGKSFITQADSALNHTSPVKARLEIFSEKVWLGVPGLPFKYSSKENSLLKRSPLLLRMWLFPTMPQYTWLTAVKLGDITILTWPGEPSAELGFRLQALASANGCSNTWIFGLTNDYVGYFTTRGEFLEGRYDSSSSIYNYRGGERILSQYDKLIRESDMAVPN